MPSRIEASELRRLRNHVPIAALIERLDIPRKIRDGELRFLCPRCADFHTATNPRTNLARCFRCRQNYNPIDLTLALRQCTFLDAVRFLRNTWPPRPEPPAIPRSA